VTLIALAELVSTTPSLTSETPVLPESELIVPVLANDPLALTVNAEPNSKVPAFTSALDVPPPPP
jgi:hypothetical protein